jgi:putative hydrolase of the HAD superfamily
MLKAIFFDLDNTLINTHQSVELAFPYLFKYIGEGIGDDWQIIFKDWKRLFSKLKKETKDYKKRSMTYPLNLLLNNKYPRLVEEAYRIFRDKVIENLSLNDGVEDFFAKERRLKMFIFTESDYAWTLRKLKGKLSRSHFSKIITSDMVKTMKPHLSYYSKIWNTFKLRPDEGLYVGDNWEKDCQIPQKRGGVGVVFGRPNVKASHSIDNMLQLVDIINQERSNE